MMSNIQYADTAVMGSQFDADRVEDFLFDSHFVIILWHLYNFFINYNAHNNSFTSLPVIIL